MSFEVEYRACLVGGTCASRPRGTQLCSSTRVAIASEVCAVIFVGGEFPSANLSSFLFRDEMQAVIGVNTDPQHGQQPKTLRRQPVLAGLHYDDRLASRHDNRSLFAEHRALKWAPLSCSSGNVMIKRRRGVR